MAFWGCTLKPVEKHDLDIPEGDLLHLSQACLHEPKGGKNYLQVTVSGKSYTVACLEKDKREHESFYLFFLPGITSFSHKGTSEIHLVGYLEPQNDDDEEEEEEDEPAAKPKAKASPKAAPVASPKAEAKAVPVKKEEAKVAAPKASPKASPKADIAKAPAKAPAPEEDADIDEMEEGEEEEPLEESEEEGNEEAASAASRAAAKGKAKAAPKPAAKQAEAGKRKASDDSGAAAKKAKGGEEGDKDAKTEKYVQEVHDYLKKHGKTQISLLGSKVHRPKELPKLGALLGRFKDKFNVSGDSVEAK